MQLKTFINNNRFFRSTALLVILLLISYFLGVHVILRIFAAGVTLTVTPSSQAVSTTANITLNFVPATGMVNGSTITVRFPVTYTGGAALTNGDIAVTKVGDANYTSAVSSNFTGTGFLITLTTAGTLDTTNDFEIVIGNANQLTTPSDAGNYTLNIVTSAGDYGAVLQYVGNANQVLVTALVPTALTFTIRNSADTADLPPGTSPGPRICDMGELIIDTTPAGPATNACQYRLRIGTNAVGGFTAQYSSNSADTTGGGFERLAASTTVNIANQPGGNIGDPLSTNTGYGVQLTPGTSISRGTTFGAITGNFFTVTADTATTMIYSAGPVAPATSPDLTGTSLLTHGARINIGQATGNYSHTITYTVTATF